MDWVYAIGCFVAVIVLALTLWWAEKRASRPVTRIAIVVGSMLLLLAVRFGFKRSWEFGLLFWVATLGGLEHIPSWLIYTVVGIGIGFFLRHILILVVMSLSDLGRELESTNARLRLMESSLRDKLEDISSRLPERE